MWSPNYTSTGGVVLAVFTSARGVVLFLQCEEMASTIKLTSVGGVVSPVYSTMFACVE